MLSEGTAPGTEVRWAISSWAGWRGGVAAQRKIAAFCYRLVRRGSENEFCSQKPPLPDTAAWHCAKE
jgi:hypothetical protein